MADDDAPSVRRDFRTNRLEAFSDGVFAIAITLLVLELSVPALGEEDLFEALLDQWPSYLAYVVSFSTVGLIWLSHTTITEFLERADYPFVRLNLILLLLVGFIPFPTQLVAEYIGDDNDERVAVTIYGVTLLLASATVALLWRYAVKHRLVTDEAAGDEEARELSRRLTPSLAAYTVFLIIGLVRPTIAVIGYLVIALLFILPIGRLFPGRRRSPV